MAVYNKPSLRGQFSLPKQSARTGSPDSNACNIVIASPDFSPGRSNLPAKEAPYCEAPVFELPVLTDCHTPQEAGLAMTKPDSHPERSRRVYRRIKS